VIGQRFGRLVVVEQVPQRIHGAVAYRCICDCGGSVLRSARDMRRGEKQGYLQGCGCTKREASAATGRGSATHGLSRRGDRAIYDTHASMLTRCTNPVSADFNQYGGRGISLCDEWKDVRAFHAWALAAGYAPGLSLDRIDNDGPYSPQNCRWATPSQQARNRRNNRHITAFGQTRLLCEWADYARISASTLRGRLRRGWTPERALTEPAIIGNNQFASS
jgi:hypothetical protein